MSDIELNQEVDATANLESQVAETPAASEPKSVELEPNASLDDVIKAAFEKSTGEAKTIKVAAPADKSTVAVADEKPIDPITGREIEEVKAPVGLPISLRDKWKEVPTAFQKYWNDRERDMSAKLNHTADERKLAKEFEDITRPYEAMLRAQNTTAAAHAKELFIFSHSMTTGTPQQKAANIDMLIRRFQPDINYLVALSNNPNAVAPQTKQADKPIDVQSEVDRVLRERDEKAEGERFTSDLTTFEADPKNEYAQEPAIRTLMSNALTGGFVTGSTYPELLAKAYAFACQHHPEIKQVLDERAKTAVVVAPAVTSPTKKPTLSVKPSAAGRAVVSRKSQSPDEAVRAAFDLHWK